MEGHISGVGLLHRSGEIKLFYMAPGMQRQGLGMKIYQVLETKARLWGLDKLHLKSTYQACAFYKAMGYKATGTAKTLFGRLRYYPYEKEL